MITFILLGVFFLIAILFAAVAYSSSQRRRAGRSGTVYPVSTANQPKQGRAV